MNISGTDRCVDLVSHSKTRITHILGSKWRQARLVAHEAAVYLPRIACKLPESGMPRLALSTGITQ